MRRVLLIGGLAAGVGILIAVAITAYAVYNLNAIIAHNQQQILHRASQELGRKVDGGKIQARLGLGLAIQFADVKVADDPAFSHEPFLSAAKISLDVQFIPLLRGKVKVQSVELAHPNFRVLRNADRKLNLDSLGVDLSEEAQGTKPVKGAGAIGEIVWTLARDLTIKALSIEDGTVYYSDATLKGAPLQINRLNIDMTGFHTGSQFAVEVKAAVLSDQSNVEVSGKMGLMLRNGALDIPSCPLDLQFRSGPIMVDSFRPLLTPGALIPVELSMPDPVTMAGTVKGTVQNLVVEVDSELPAYRILYRPAANQPGNVPRTLDLNGAIAIYGAAHPLDARPNFDWTAALTQFSVRFESAQRPAITNLNGQIHLTPAGLAVEPTRFTIGSGQASLEATSLSPLRAEFTFEADSLQLSEIVPSRPPGEFVRRLTVSGRINGELSAPLVTARIKAAAGFVQSAAFTNLDLTGGYVGKRVYAEPLSVDTFDGSMTAIGHAMLGALAPFEGSVNFKHINVTDAMRWLDIHSTALTGYLNGDLTASGAGASWPEIRPTLRGNGQVYLSRGELHGINIVGVTLNKISAAPGVSQLISVAFRSSHQALLSASNTDLSRMSMDFNLHRARVSTNDLLVKSPDYQITGTGWFDFDKNIDMSGDIKLTLGLSAAIPVVVMGQYPELLVLPNIPKLAIRTAIGVVTAPANLIRGGANALGNTLGGIRNLLP